MTEKQKVWLSWSSGKDSAWSLKVLRENPLVEVVGLLTTVDENQGRVAMHDVRPALLARQAEALGLDLIMAAIPHPCSNARYQEVMRGVVARAIGEGVAAMAFGDLFLEDIRRYREDRLAATGLEALFPLWGRDTGELAREMIAGGLKAVLTCVDLKCLPAAVAGRSFDARLLEDLPAGVDPCGENGEFHSFVHDGPGFESPIPIAFGDRVVRDGFAFLDLLSR